MPDLFIDRLKENEKILSTLSDEDLRSIALSEMMMELAMGDDVPPGVKAKRVALSAALAGRAGVKF